MRLVRNRVLTESLLREDAATQVTLELERADIHGPGALGFSEDASATFHNGKVSLNLGGDIDVGLAGFNFHIGLTIDVQGAEKTAEHAIVSAAEDLGGYCKVAAVAVSHGVETAAVKVEHAFEDFGHKVVSWFRSW